MTSPAYELEKHLQNNIGQTLFGMNEVIHGLCIGLVAKGHTLVEGVPGLGKTLVAKTLSRHLRGEFKRIQCTADMMPSDLTGIHVYNADTRSFELLEGPLFADVVLVDEINRTGPKTQSALLQAMEEGGITLDRKTYSLPEEFFVIASQNPHEFEGTYPLLESQLDRFLIKIKIDYPDAETEKQVLRAYDHPGGGHDNVTHGSEALPENILKDARDQAATVYVSDTIYNYCLALAQATRSHQNVSLGMSTRGALALMRCARVEAATRNGDFVTPDDIKTVARMVMSHRLILTPDALLEGKTGEQMTTSILDQIEVPRLEDLNKPASS